MPRRSRSAARVLLALVFGGLATSPTAGLAAQGSTTVAIRGTVRLADGGDADDARVVVRNLATGFAVETGVRRGRFLIPSLEPGGPYAITVRRIGARARRWEGIHLTLGEPFELDVTLESSPIELDSIVTVSAPGLDRSSRHGGTAISLSDSLIHRLPSLNRNVYDFLALVPQISTRIGFTSPGISGGGAGFRFNHFLTNGVSERSLAGAQPPEFANGKSLPFEAVRDYQVLIAPFDVRYGDFAGAMVNAVTRSGDNRFSGSGFVLGRNDALSREELSSPYQRWQYGISLSGPIVRDRAHFFLATELQRETAPMAGPFVGQPDGAQPPVPAAGSDLARLDTIFRRYGLSAGSGGPVTNRSRIGNLFARVDVGLPELNTRAVLWLNTSQTRVRRFSRDQGETFVLSSQVTETAFSPRTLALQTHTRLPGAAGANNEFSLSYRSIPSFGSEVAVQQPVVNVVLPRVGGGFTTALTGTPAITQSVTRLRDVTLRDELTLPFGATHVANLGAELEWFSITPSGLVNGFGTWTFSSLDSLDAGLADRYELAREFGNGAVPLSGSQLSLWAGDHWRPGSSFSLTFGLRADLLAAGDAPPYQRLVDSLIGRRTDVVQRRRIELSPRIGFTLDLPGSARDQVRGGIGIFSGRPPLAWLHLPLQSYGDGIGTLRCGRLPGDLGLPPPFQPDPHTPPVTCAGGAGLNAPPRGDVELIDPELRMTRTLRAVLAYERSLPGRLTGTFEALISRHLTDFVFVNRNLAGPQGIDRRGRVLYGSIDPAGRGRPVRITDSFPSIIELRNVSDNTAIQLAAAVRKQFEGGFAAMASYTWSRVRDVQTPLRVNVRGVVNWSLRAVAGRHEDLSPGISLNDVPHRLTFAATWRAPWRAWSTEVAVMYVGESGSPFTWRTFGAGGRGDLNADGGQNDPIYVPRDAFDGDEILFDGFESGADNSPEAQAARIEAQRAAFEGLIESTDCLRRNRGSILLPNSCREPWAHSTAASLRQTIPVVGRALEAQLDVFNLLNLMHRSWGIRRLAEPALLEHVGQVPAPSGPAEPVFRLNQAAVGWTASPEESRFQMQFGLRYRF